MCFKRFKIHRGKSTHSLKKQPYIFAIKQYQAIKKVNKKIKKNTWSVKCWLSVVLMNNQLIITGLYLCQIVMINAENSHCSNNVNWLTTTEIHLNQYTRTPCAQNCMPKTYLNNLLNKHPCHIIKNRCFLVIKYDSWIQCRTFYFRTPVRKCH